MVSRILKGAALTLATTGFAATASAGCNNGSAYCSSSNNYMTHSSAPAYGSVTLPDTYNPSMAYGSVSSSYTTSSYGGVMSSSMADASYGTGSISDTYTGGDVQMYGFSGSTTSVPGLGQHEFLQGVNCPTNVYNPDGGRVVGCYNVVKQVPQTNYVRVVRPIIYVRYPVPVAVPVYGCGMNYAYNYNHGHNHHAKRRRCR